MMICSTTFAGETLFKQARALQRDGKFDEAIDVYKQYLAQPIDGEEISDKELFFYTESLVQITNTFQSKGDPEGCIQALEEVFGASAFLQKECLRDYYSVLGYALSRTENVNKAEECMIKALVLPLYRATPERYFRDYAYAAAVFYSNTEYLEQVISWCHEALKQAELCKNTSGAQWVKAMLGSLYKQNGDLNKALELLKQSRAEAEKQGDDLGVINSLNTLIDLLLYWDIPEYANQYASEAIRVEERMSEKNPMVSAQTYINKGRALYRLGVTDSVSLYTQKARELCQALPYNSGMVDVNLLHGRLMSEKDGDLSQIGIAELEQVTKHGTLVNRAKAYHQLAQTYLRHNNNKMAETMLDSLYTLLNASDAPLHLNLNYEPILNHYFKSKQYSQAEKYAKLMLQEQQALNAKKLNYNIVGSIIDLQKEHEIKDLKISHLKQENKRFWVIVCLILYVITTSALVIMLLYRNKRIVKKMLTKDKRFALLVKELNESNSEKEKLSLEIRDFLKDSDNRKRSETLTPFVLKEGDETKFRQCFELLYPLFLHRLRERVPSITRREELLCMLIVLKQDNKEIADLLAIAPRSVLMLRHRFRQKIGLPTEYSLENFIEDTLGYNNNMNNTVEINSEQQDNKTIM